MKFFSCALVWLTLALVSYPCLAQQQVVPGISAPLVHREWTVEGARREALIYFPPNAAKTDTAHSQPAPLIFAFHGHGGNMRNAARSFPFPKLWPEAVVIYMQGLNTPGRLTDPEGKKAGWQHAAGDQGDRDLKFFDIVLTSIKAEQSIDPRRIYCTGHSNGGGFTYLLWAQRGDVFAAMAPSAATASKALFKLTPKPVLHVAGEADPLVKYSWQQATIQALIRLNQAGPGQAWGQDANCTEYVSRLGFPVITAIHPGGHEFHPDAPPLMVKFFKQHALKGDLKQ